MKRRRAKTKLEMEEALPQLTLAQGQGRRKKMLGQQAQAPTQARQRSRRGMKREGSSLERCDKTLFTSFALGHFKGAGPGYTSHSRAFARDSLRELSESPRMRP